MPATALNAVLRRFASDASAMLRSPTDARISFLATAGVILACGTAYGAMMGTFGGIAGDRLLQVLYSAVKVPVLLLFTFFLCIPSYFVLNGLLGLRSSFGSAITALLRTQALLAVVLGSLGPFTLLWYASTENYPNAVLFNALMFGVASAAAQWVLRRLYKPLIAQNARHRHAIRIWIVLYAFVGIQLGWVLRPFVGKPDLHPTFLRSDCWSNAYVAVAELLGKSAHGRSPMDETKP